MYRLIMALATGFHVGNIGRAPGTLGSLVAIIPWLFCRQLDLLTYGFVLLGLFVLGFFVAGSAEKILDSPDAGCIVIDEILGMFITLTAAPNHPMAWGIGFVLFRIFDILKPFPVSWFDQHLHGGLGIMLDDVMAGLYSFFCLQLGWYLFGLF